METVRRNCDPIQAQLINKTLSCTFENNVTTKTAGLCHNVTNSYCFNKVCLGTLLPGPALCGGLPVFMTNLNFFNIASLMRSVILLFSIFCKEESNVSLIPPQETSPISDLFVQKAMAFVLLLFSCLYL